MRQLSILHHEFLATDGGPLMVEWVPFARLLAGEEARERIVVDSMAGDF